MDLYLDTEFNGHGGELVSLALASPDGRHFYQVAPEPRTWNAWVFEHVFPHLDKDPVASMDEFRFCLREYLQSREGLNCTIYADWPDDFAHLMRLMSGPSYDTSWMIGCTLVLLRESDPKPEKPHNALSDAIALMDWHRAASKAKKAG